MLPLFTSEEMRALDRRAISEFGIPGMVLMENAATRLAEFLFQEVAPPEDLSVCVFCGPGNNGGDGFALARLLFLRGAEVEVWLLTSPENLTGDARTNFEICRTLEVPILQPESPFDIDFQWYDVVVDAIFGTGVLRTPEGIFAEVIEAINDSELPVLAVDIPSGVDAGTGQQSDPSIHATWTLTFQCGKPGLYLPPGKTLAGEVKIVPISLPVSAEDMLAAKWFAPEPQDVAALFVQRPPESHKGDFGKLLILAGSQGMSGAARLASLAALRSGVGLLKVGVPESIRAEVAAVAEAMVIGLPQTAKGALSASAWEQLEPLLNWADAVAIGPGWGTAAETAELLSMLLTTDKTLVIDADGLNLIAEHKLLNRIPKGAVLTPHPGELTRLSGQGSSCTHERVEIARTLAQKYNAVIHVKSSASTTVTPDGSAFVNSTGNPGLATGGSGDILTGMIGALLAQGIPPAQAAWGAAFVHGRAADIAAELLGEISLLPTDVIAAIPQVLQDLHRELQ